MAHSNNSNIMQEVQQQEQQLQQLQQRGVSMSISEVGVGMGGLHEKPGDVGLGAGVGVGVGVGGMQNRPPSSKQRGSSMKLLRFWQKQQEQQHQADQRDADAIEMSQVQLPGGTDCYTAGRREDLQVWNEDGFRCVRCVS